jgi:hypothetical protein
MATLYSSVRDQPMPFWNGASWDGPNKGIGDLLQTLGYSDLEFLHNGAGEAVEFRFDDPAIATTLLYNITAWTGGVLGRNEFGAFTYNSGTGRISNSWTMPGQYALFRRVGAGYTQYFMGVEDILLSELRNDRDYNDHVVTFTLPTPVPEPSTLLLLGLGLAAAARRSRAQPG